MTEEEAKTKWCPHAFAATGLGVKYREDNEGNVSKCIASNCMMWVSGASEEAVEQAKGMGCGIPRGGHCGLAK